MEGLRGEVRTGSEFAISHCVVPPPSLANMGSFTVFSLLTCFSLVQIASFEAVVKPLCEFQLRLCWGAHFRQHFTLQGLFRTEGTISYWVMVWLTMLAGGVLPAGGQSKTNLCRFCSLITQIIFFRNSLSLLDCMCIPFPEPWEFEKDLQFTFYL